MLFECWQVSVVSVGQFDRKRLLKGTLLLDCQSGFSECFAGTRHNSQIADPDRLKSNFDFGRILDRKSVV